jgi:hypothetical protein
MKLLTFYSESHEEMYEKYFLDSYNKYLSQSFELIPNKIEQICVSGEYGSDGFSHAMMEKINHIINNIDVKDNEPLVFADCDIQFFSDFSKEITQELGGYDIKFQTDVTCLCAGFFVCKQSAKVLKFFTDVKSVLETVMDKKVDDQQVINHIIHKYPINWGLLSNKFFTVAMATGPRQWNGEDFQLTEDIYTHHANWTVGLENKYKLLDMTKEKMSTINAD